MLHVWRSTAVKHTFSIGLSTNLGSGGLLLSEKELVCSVVACKQVHDQTDHDGKHRFLKDAKPRLCRSVPLSSTCEMMLVRHPAKLRQMSCWHAEEHSGMPGFTGSRTDTHTSIQPYLTYQSDPQLAFPPSFLGLVGEAQDQHQVQASAQPPDSWQGRLTCPGVRS